MLERLVPSPRKLLQRWRMRTYREKYDISDDIEFVNVGTLLSGDGTIEIGAGSYVSNDTKIHAHERCSVVIGENTAIGDQVRIYTRNKIAEQDMSTQSVAALDEDSFRYGDVIIGDNCWIGARVSVIEDTEIGKNTTVGTHSVVTRDIPPHCVAAGNPARVVKFKPYLSESEVARLSAEYPKVTKSVAAASTTE